MTSRSRDAVDSSGSPLSRGRTERIIAPPLIPAHSASKTCVNALMPGIQGFAAAMSPSMARSRSSSPVQAAAHGVRNVLPGATARPFARRALLVDAVEELVSIGHRDPGVAHPDVELALVFLIAAL